MEDPLKDAKRLGTEAMSPCIGCGRQLLATGMPIFYRVQVSQCGIDANEVRQHVGLAMHMGGGEAGLALAGVLGPRVEPVVVIHEGPVVNICSPCQNKPEWMMLAHAALHSEEGND